MKEKKTIKWERTAGVVVFRRKGDSVLYLLLQRVRGNWVLPGGKIEVGERYLDTARRETAEETGISRIRIIPNFREIVRFSYNWPPKSQDQEVHVKTAVLYLGQVFTNYVRLSPEHKAFLWVPFERALKVLKHRNWRELIIKANAAVSKQNNHAV